MIVLVMGVAGAGKTTVGRMLAATLGYEFSDADSFHTPENVDKMRRGIALSDADREPWLRDLAAAVDDWLARDRDVVLACSALTAAYRAILLRDPSRMRLVYLKISPAIAHQRVSARRGHYMPGALVETQFEVLEEPAGREGAIVADASQPPDVLVRTVAAAL